MATISRHMTAPRPRPSRRWTLRARRSDTTTTPFPHTPIFKISCRPVDMFPPSFPPFPYSFSHASMPHFSSPTADGSGTLPSSPKNPFITASSPPFSATHTAFFENDMDRGHPFGPGGGEYNLVSAVNHSRSHVPGTSAANWPQHVPTTFTQNGIATAPGSPEAARFGSSRAASFGGFEDNQRMSQFHAAQAEYMRFMQYVFMCIYAPAFIDMSLQGPNAVTSPPCSGTTVGC